jgi:hypothetical protein
MLGENTSPRRITRLGDLDGKELRIPQLGTQKEPRTNQADSSRETLCVSTYDFGSVLLIDVFFACASLSCKGFM